MNRVLAVAWSREHDEHFKIGHLKSKLPTDHDFLEQFFCFDFFHIGHFVVVGSFTCTGAALLLAYCCCYQMATLTTNKRFTYEKENRDPFITLHLNVQF